MKVKEESKKVGLKLNIQKTKIMASWQRVGETMETVTNFILGGSKITADGDTARRQFPRSGPDWRNVPERS